MTQQALFEHQPGDTPLIISFPHSGTYVPPELARRLRPEVLDLPDTDWFVPELYRFAHELGATQVRATHTRYVVDLNRPPDGAPLYPGQRETTVCPTESFDGEKLYQNGQEPSADEIGERLSSCWQPYHDQLTASIREVSQRHGYCILWDAHSIHSQVPALFPGTLPDLNVGTSNGRSCAPSILERVVAPLSTQERFSYVVDGRFKGGYITRHYGEPPLRVEAVQMEIAQSAYVIEQRVPIFDAERARPLSTLLRKVLVNLLKERG